MIEQLNKIHLQNNPPKQKLQNNSQKNLNFKNNYPPKKYRNVGAKAEKNCEGDEYLSDEHPWGHK